MTLSLNYSLKLGFFIKPFPKLLNSKHVKVYIHVGLMTFACLLNSFTVQRYIKIKDCICIAVHKRI